MIVIINPPTMPMTIPTTSDVERFEEEKVLEVDEIPLFSPLISNGRSSDVGDGVVVVDVVVDVVVEVVEVVVDVVDVVDEVVDVVVEDVVEVRVDVVVDEVVEDVVDVVDVVVDVVVVVVGIGHVSPAVPDKDQQAV